jgi:hypothetical protein
MPRNILETYSGDLASRAESADDSTKRAVALAACKWAVDRELPDDSIVQSALARLESGNYGDPRFLAALQDHVDKLDLIYFEARDAAQDFFPLFVKARVANAVLFALDSDPFVAVIYSLYELCASLGTEAVQAEIDRVLS